MASVTELAYTPAAEKRINSSPICQSFKNKNKCSSMERRSFRSFSFKHTYINTAAISTSLNIGGLGITKHRK